MIFDCEIEEWISRGRPDNEFGEVIANGIDRDEGLLVGLDGEATGSLIEEAFEC
jgi:hypothetical protein